MFVISLVKSCWSLPFAQKKAATLLPINPESSILYEYETSSLRSSDEERLVVSEVLYLDMYLWSSGNYQKKTCWLDDDSLAAL